MEGERRGKEEGRKEGIQGRWKLLPLANQTPTSFRRQCWRQQQECTCTNGCLVLAKSPPQWSLTGELAPVRQAGQAKPVCLRDPTHFLSPTLLPSMLRGRALTCDQRTHDDSGGFSLHHWDLVHRVRGR